MQTVKTPSKKRKSKVGGGVKKKRPAFLLSPGAPTPDAPADHSLELERLEARRVQLEERSKDLQHAHAEYIATKAEMAFGCPTPHNTESCEGSSGCLTCRPEKLWFAARALQLAYARAWFALKSWWG